MSKELLRIARREPDPYAVLQVSPCASIEVIRAAYRALARGIHPDVSGPDLTANRRMRELNAAYGLVSNPLRRADYDARHRAPVRARPPADVPLAGRTLASVTQASATQSASRRWLSTPTIVLISIVTVLCVSTMVLIVVSVLLDELDDRPPGALTAVPHARVDSIWSPDPIQFESAPSDVSAPQLALRLRVPPSGDDPR
jgi:DnaJ domain